DPGSARDPGEMDLASQVSVAGRYRKARIAELDQPELEGPGVEPDRSTNVRRLPSGGQVEGDAGQAGARATPLRRLEAVVAGEDRRQEDVGIGRKVADAVVRQNAPVTAARERVGRQAVEGPLHQTGDLAP